MGGGITVAQGLRRIEPDAVHFAFIGDSTFFHSGITGVINAVYNQTDIVVVILDNATTAMTGNQPHPGMGVTMMGGKPDKISIAAIVEAIGVSSLIRVDPLDQKAAKDAVKTVIGQKGVRVLLFESPCIYIEKSTAKAAVDTSKCTGCTVCLKRYGCPAISFDNIADGRAAETVKTEVKTEVKTTVRPKAQIDSNLCTGCGVCATLCAPGAIQVKGSIEK